MAKSIVHEVTYAHAPEKVWRAITDAQLVSQWLMPTDLAPRVGAKFRMTAKPMPGWRGIVDGEVLVCEPPRRLVYSWDGDGKGKPPTRVEWTLTPTPEGGTRLRLEHSGFTGFGGFVAKMAMKNGWGEKVRDHIPLAIEGKPIPQAH